MARKAAKKTTRATYKVECFDGMTSKVVKRGISASEAKKLAADLGKKFSKYVYTASREAAASSTPPKRKPRKR